MLAPVRYENDDDFCAYVTGELARLPGVHAVALGGSRAGGTHRPDSDWDFAVYYRRHFDPEHLRALGWPGEMTAIGGWGGGVFNGGGWFEVDGRRVDVHYRDLNDVEYHLAEAREGRFRIERLLYHLAGIPTYIVVAELALNRIVHGHLEQPAYPDALRESAPRHWRDIAALTLAYGRAAYAGRGRLTETAGAIATAACQAGHAVLAARGEWVTNEKTLLDRAGLRGIDEVLAGLSPAPEALIRAVDAVTGLIEAATVPSW